MLTLAALVPPQFAAVLFATAGVALICRARRLAGVLLLAGVALILAPLLLRQMRAVLPAWLTVLFGLGGALAIGRAALVLAVGRSATSTTIGILTADVVRLVVLLPFRVIGGLLAVILGRQAQ